MKRVIVVVGPTGVGKTKLSVELAKLLNGEVINADSTQVYKELDVATAKITEEEKENVPHHLFDIRDVEQDYTVFDYQLDCRNEIDKITQRGHIPILVGGTGLYIKAALYDYKFDDEERKDYSMFSNEELYNKLISVDPNTEIHMNNRKRVERALTYFFNNNKPYSEKEKTNTPLYDINIIGLTMDRSQLYERINHRVDVMIDNGLLDEAKKIYKSNIRTKAILTPIGYKELFPYFDNIDTLENCIDKIKQNSRKYAKRQYTWFLHQMDVKWYNVEISDFDKTVNEVYENIKKLGY